MDSDAQQCREGWMARQQCCLCGGRRGLRLFRHGGAPPVTWNQQGPSHTRFRIVCGDAEACLYRRTRGKRPSPELKPTDQQSKSWKDRHRLQVLRGEAVPSNASKTPPAPVQVTVCRRSSQKPRPKKKSEIARGLAKSDKRPRCPTHGPKGTMIYNGAVRFLCCGRVVPIEPKPVRRIV